MNTKFLKNRDTDRDQSQGLGSWIRVRDLGWRLGIRVRDWSQGPDSRIKVRDLGKGLGLGIGVRDQIERLRLGIRVGDQGWRLGLGIGVRDQGKGLRGFVIQIFIYDCKRYSFFLNKICQHFLEKMLEVDFAKFLCGIKLFESADRSECLSN